MSLVKRSKSGLKGRSLIRRGALERPDIGNQIFSLQECGEGVLRRALNEKGKTMGKNWDRRDS